MYGDFSEIIGCWLTGSISLPSLSLKGIFESTWYFIAKGLHLLILSAAITPPFKKPCSIIAFDPKFEQLGKNWQSKSLALYEIRCHAAIGSRAIFLFKPVPFTLSKESTG